VNYFQHGELVRHDLILLVPPARVLAAKPAVRTVAVVAAAVINRADYLVNIQKPENSPGLFVAAQTLVREMPAFVAISPATADVLLHFFTFICRRLNYMFYM
jgi:hypothetical protein